MMHVSETRYNNRYLTITITFCVLLLFQLTIGSGITYAPFHTCASQSQYFEVNSLSCIDCVPNSIGSVNRCYCKTGYREDFVNGRMNCSDCVELGLVSSLDRSICLECNSNLTLGFNATSRDCGCPMNSILVEKGLLGGYLDQKECRQCPVNSYRSSLYTCTQCPDPSMIFSSGKCSCASGHTEWNNNCLKEDIYSPIANQFPIEIASTLEYIQVFERNRKRDSSSTESVRSQFFYNNLYTAGAKCRSTGDSTACNMLANMCVLTLYRDSSPCRLFDQILNENARADLINGYSGWKQGMPFLKYSDPSRKIMYNDPIKMKVSFDKIKGKSSTLKYILSMYNITGEWLGFKELTTELQLCQGDRYMDSLYLKFGTNFENTCYFNVFWMLQAPTPIFYDLYLLDSDGLKPIPVQILYNDRRWDFPREVLTPSKLFRRFFLYDNIAGKKVGGTTPDVVRFAEFVQLRVKLHMRSRETIYTPLLTIKYSSRKIDGISNYGTNFSSAGSLSIYQPVVSFSVLYEKEMKIAWIVVITFISVFILLSACGSIIGVWRYSRRRQMITLELTILVKFVVYFVCILSNMMFLVLFIICTYWYLFFKHQKNVSVLLPRSHGVDLLYYGLVLCFCFSGKLIEQLSLLYKQTQYDIFFIDWERSRGKIVENRGRSGNYSPISMWRTVHIASEWRKLQTASIINMEFTILFLLVLIYGCNLIGLATEQPNVKLLSGPYPRNTMSRFIIVTIFWLSIAAGQYLYKRLFYFRFVHNPLTLFIDKCSLANISMMILTESNYGYYIHGESVHPFSDANMREFNEYLQKETTNAILSRGLVPNPAAPSVQTFEIFVSHEFRKMYNEKFSDAIAHEKIRMRNQIPQRGAEMSQQNLLNKGAATTPANPGYEVTISLDRFYKLVDMGLTLRKKVTYPLHLFDSYLDLNEFLKQTINDLKLKQDQIVEKQLTMRLGIPPDLSQVQKSYFFYDKFSYAFRNVLPMGSELTSLIFYITLYAVIDMGADNPFFSFIGVYLMSKLITFIRTVLLRRNLINKTLLDDRFLIN